MSKSSRDSFYQSFSSLFTNHLEVHSRWYMFLRKRRSCEYRHCRYLARIAVALIALNCRSVFGHIQCTTLPAKQAITVGSSSGLNVKLLHDWSNFDLPKLMPVEHIFLMPSSCFSHCHANKLLITA